MIDEQDRALQEWIRTTVDAPAVTQALPTNNGDTPGCTVYLMEMRSEPANRGTRDVPLRLILRYLVTSGIGAFEETHRWLGELLLAALEHPEYEVEREPIPLAFWQAVGAAPRPAFVLRVPFCRERADLTAKRVRQQPTIRAAETVPLEGVVLGPGDIPIVDALVEVTGLGLARRTDGGGRFSFRNVPAAPQTNILRITAKKHVLSHPVTRAPTDTAPIVIHFEMEDA